MIQKSIKISTKIKRGCLNNAYQIPRGSAPGLFIIYLAVLFKCNILNKKMLIKLDLNV